MCHPRRRTEPPDEPGGLSHVQESPDPAPARALEQLDSRPEILTAANSLPAHGPHLTWRPTPFRDRVLGLQWLEGSDCFARRESPELTNEPEARMVGSIELQPTRCLASPTCLAVEANQDAGRLLARCHGHRLACLVRSRATRGSPVTVETITLEAAVAGFGAAVTKKSSSVVVSGAAEEQLRGPLEQLVGDLAELAGLDRRALAIIGESTLGDLKVRPDFAVSYRNVLVGFIEVKAPGKGADPRRYKGEHDRDQWKKLSALPNLIYTDGNTFSLWRSGDREGAIIQLDGDVETSGKHLGAPEALVGLFRDFLNWEPIAPRKPKQLAELSAGMCRLLRDEVREQLELDSPSLAHLADDWRQLLFPEATDEQFADGFAQTVTFGLLLARARGIDLTSGLDSAAKELGERHSLMGTALQVFTQGINDGGLVTSVRTLTRVLAVVDWPTISKGNPEAWLYFYEDFLSAYDAKLRRRTGSYYTPPEIVQQMTRFVDDALRERFGLARGLAEPNVTVLDPAVGTGTYMLAILRAVANSVAESEGEGAVAPVLEDTLHRVIGFELQLGPFAVAQLRIMAELAEWQVRPGAATDLRLYVADTLANPHDDEHHVGWLYEPIAESRREANRIKRDEPVTVVLGNPPYREKSHGTGGWVEHGLTDAGQTPILNDFMPPAELGVAAHVKHLYNPYVYFWRWATWKVFDQQPGTDHGVVCFITVAGFLNGPGFQQMRTYLRRRADAIWIIDCSPEGHQPPVATRVFQGVQQPVCIMLAVRDGTTDDNTPAPVYYRPLARGPRTAKFDELANLDLQDDGWEASAAGWREPFLPAGREDWTSYPALDDLLRWSGSGIMPGRTWPIAPDKATLTQRWDALIKADPADKPELLSEHPTDRTVNTVLSDGLPGHPRQGAIIDETGSCPPPVQVGYRSFDRQWLIPDKRLINRPNPTLWRIHSENQVYLTALTRHSPSSGPAATATGLLPDLHHYKGSFGGRAYPLWLNAEATEPNVTPGLPALLAARLDHPVTAEDVFAYIAAVTAHPSYVALFADDLKTPGLRIPLTSDPSIFQRAVQEGRRALWLHTFGTRFADDKARPPRPRRAPQAAEPPKMLEPIGTDLPDELTYEPDSQRLHIGAGVVAPVAAAVRKYEVSGVNVVDKWFSYRRATRDRPVIGDRRQSPLLNMRSDRWLPSYTTELLEMLNVLTLLIELEPAQERLLGDIIAGPKLSTADLTSAGVLPMSKAARKPIRLDRGAQASLEL